MSHYIKRQKGIALIIVLIFMQILAMLSWYALSNVLLMTQSVKNSIQHNHTLNTAMQILHQIEESVLYQLPRCVIAPIAADVLAAKPLSWWQSSLTCDGNFQGLKYYYVVESLGTDGCATVQDTTSIAEYFRITLYDDSSARGTSLLLQSTVVRPNDLHEPCQGMQHVVMLGRQAWRELNE